MSTERAEKKGAEAERSRKVKGENRGGEEGGECRQQRE